MKSQLLVFVGVLLLALGTWACGSSAQQELDVLISGDNLEDGPGGLTCLELQNAAVTEYPPAGLRVTFRLLDCEGLPVGKLSAGQVTVINDDTGQPFGAGHDEPMVSEPLSARDLDLRLLLLVDLSSSALNLGLAPNILQAARTLVTALAQSPARTVRVALWTMGSPSKTVQVLDFTSDLDQVLASLTQLEASPGLGARDLYGGFTKGLNALAQLEGTGSDQKVLALFAAGLHETGGAAALAQQAVQLRQGLESSEGLQVLVLGSADSGFSSLQQLASRPEYAFNTTGADWAQVAGKAGKALSNALGSNYVLGVCTPLVFGSPTLTLDVKVGTASVAKQLPYSVEGFTGDLSQCDPKVLADPCGDRLCGDSALPGVTCGTCDAGWLCDGEGACSIPCSPQCQNRDCGSDACGGSCGDCANNEHCDEGGQCQAGCLPNCSGKQCGGDGCNGSCGTCTNGKTCNANGLCITDCVPNCSGKQCGSDGCNGSCGTCSNGKTCNANGLCVTDCVPNCSGKQCGSDGCNGSCGTCTNGKTCNANGLCVTDCVPNCSGKQCGSDGCNGSCGTCTNGKTCNANGLCITNCVPNCSGKQCGSDGCNGSCGTCTNGKTCNANGLCVTNCVPDCSYKECGDDGCGGSCGNCKEGEACEWYGGCVCMGGCGGKECGWDNCGNSCGTCDSGQYCSTTGECRTTIACPEGGILMDTTCNGTDYYGCCVGEVVYYCGNSTATCPLGLTKCLCALDCNTAEQQYTKCQKRATGGRYMYLCSTVDEDTIFYGDVCPWDR
jgi:hypothetical protein